VSLVDKQILDMLSTRFDAIDDRLKVGETVQKDTLKLVHCIDKKIVVNATNITWHTWSLRGIWAAGLTGILTWLGLR